MSKYHRMPPNGLYLHNGQIFLLKMNYNYYIIIKRTVFSGNGGYCLISKLILTCRNSQHFISSTGSSITVWSVKFKQCFSSNWIQSSKVSVDKQDKYHTIISLLPIYFRVLCRIYSCSNRIIENDHLDHHIKRQNFFIIARVYVLTRPIEMRVYSPFSQAFVWMGK